MVTEIPKSKLNIAVIGGGISGLSAAWLLSREHNVTLYEANTYIGGHTNTVDIQDQGKTIAVDTGFIVYNEPAYPNLTRLFEHLGVETVATEMSFSVSLAQGALEYAGNGLDRLFAQRSNLLSPRFWRMLIDVRKFYAQAPVDVATAGDMSLGDYLERHRYSQAFAEDHLYPMAAAIWSMSPSRVGDYPFVPFVNFCVNHGLLLFKNRPLWRTVRGGSREYVKKITENYAKTIRLDDGVETVTRLGDSVEIKSKHGTEKYDHVVISSHADQALRMLADPDEDEKALLGCFDYTENKTFLHSDAALMPRDRKVWSSWNYLADERGLDTSLTVTYWMNSLQELGTSRPIFVSLNPCAQPRSDMIFKQMVYHHPVFNVRTLAAQKKLWSLQGCRRTWFCGSYFGYGFHEDGLQSGLAVAEHLSGIRRPWQVANESGRILITSPDANLS